MGQLQGTVQFAAGSPAPADGGGKPVPRFSPRLAWGSAPSVARAGRRGPGAALTVAAAALAAAAAARRGLGERRCARRWRRSPRRVPAESSVATAAAAAGTQAEVGSPAQSLIVSLWPQLLLVFVAALYGSLGICLRGIYSLDGPPTPAALSLVRQFLTVLVFVPMLSWGGSGGKGSSGSQFENLPPGFWAASLELATWNLGTQGLLNAGLALTGAARASFLAQLSVVITPVFARLSGQRVPGAVWAGCVVALVGVLLLGTDGAEGGGSLIDMLFSGFNLGDLMCLASAATWSAYIFRLGILSRRSLPSVPLQAAKTALLCALYLCWAAVDWLLLRHCPLPQLWPGCASPLAWGILLFSAIGPGALGDVWMQRAADRLPAATANVLLAMEPLFAAGFAGALLGERLGFRGLWGAVLIFAAAVVVGSSDRGNEASDEKAGDSAAGG